MKLNYSSFDAVRAAARQMADTASQAFQPETSYGDLARPELMPKPNCKVKLICGPPAAGKSTYVNQRKGPDDIVIDLDLIAREHGFGRNRPSDAVGQLLLDRNQRLAALAEEPPDRVAWVIIGAPSMALRRWWCEKLNIADGDLIVMVPAREELRRRIMADPERRPVRKLHLDLIDRWLERERDNDPGRIVKGIGADGFPSDPLHSWNR